ncbi:MAG: T9SS type A sorting domain-containing protein, partial [Saprospiraceae bacterium]|nr:T9SS type A sorting domain-containing protein [Saprospiraceae bacterium]
GFDRVRLTDLQDPEFEVTSEFLVYPNPTTRTVYFNKVVDVAIYDANGRRVRVERNTSELDVSNLTTGMYFIQTSEGQIQKLVIQ